MTSARVGVFGQDMIAIACQLTPGCDTPTAVAQVCGWPSAAMAPAIHLLPYYTPRMSPEWAAASYQLSLPVCRRASATHALLCWAPQAAQSKEGCLDRSSESSSMGQLTGSAESGGQSLLIKKFDWRIEPHRISVCKRPDGSPWQLGVGGYGRARPLAGSSVCIICGRLHLRCGKLSAWKMMFLI